MFVSSECCTCPSGLSGLRSRAYDKATEERMLLPWTAAMMCCVTCVFVRHLSLLVILLFALHTNDFSQNWRSWGKVPFWEFPTRPKSAIILELMALRKEF